MYFFCCRIFTTGQDGDTVIFKPSRQKVSHLWCTVHKGEFHIIYWTVKLIEYLHGNFYFIKTLFSKIHCWSATRHVDLSIFLPNYSTLFQTNSIILMQRKEATEKIGASLRYIQPRDIFKVGLMIRFIVCVQNTEITPITDGSFCSSSVTISTHGSGLLFSVGITTHFSSSSC